MAWPVLAQDITADEKKVIDARLTPAAALEKKVPIEVGGTVFLTQVVEVPANRIRRAEADYEGLVFKPIAPTGVTIHKRLDQFRFTKKGNNVEVSMRFAISVEPGTSKGGGLEATLTLIERAGLANEVVSNKVKFEVVVSPPKATSTDLAADFQGYRLYKAIAQRQQQDLEAAGLRGLSLKDGVALPALDRVDGAKVERIYDFDRSRRRMAVAKRHLEAISQSSDRALAAQARQYLSLLDAPPDQLKGLPDVPLLGGRSGSAAAAVEDVKGPAAKPAELPKSKTVGEGFLQPLETTKKPEPEASPKPAPEVPKAPVVVNPAKPAQETTVDGEELSFDRRSRKETPLPTYPRALTLDDPNVGFGGWVRFGYSRVIYKQLAFTPVWFIGGQASITRDLGVELTIPTSLVSVNLSKDGSANIFSMGNPLLAAKYRFHLWEIMGRRPVLTLRARWGIPISAKRPIPRSSLDAEDFTDKSNFVDHYAFTLEKTDIGLGFSTAWQLGLAHVAGQFYVDYYTPVKGAADQIKYTTLGYGLAFGIRPWDFAGAYVEARGTTLISGPVRNEWFVNVGARGRLLGLLEPALWLGIPIGSISRTSSVQLGAEIRVSYDVESVMVRGKSSKDERLLE